MKKFAYLAAAAALALGLCSCTAPGGSPDSDPGATPAPQVSSQGAQETEPPADPADPGSSSAVSDPGAVPVSERPELSEQGAMDRVRDLLQADYDTSFAIEGTALLPLDGDPDEHPAYLVHAFTGEGGPTATVGRYAVGIREDLLWVMDDSGEYQFSPGGTPLVDWSAGLPDGSLGLVIRNPDEYYQWALQPVLQCDASGGDPYAETILLCPLYDSTKIVLLTGSESLEDWTFVGEEFTSFSLDRGEYALVKCTVPEGIPSFAVTFVTDTASAEYIVGYDGTGDINKPAYVSPAGAED